MKQTNQTRRLAYLGMMTALVFVANYARIVLPISVGGNTAFTLANIVCALAGLMLGPVGGLASGLGSAIYDLMNPLYAATCWITFLSKGALGLVAGLVCRTLCKKSDRLLYGKLLVATVAGCVAYYILYFTKTFFVAGLFAAEGSALLGLTVIAMKIPASIFNAGIAILAAPPAAIVLGAALKKSGLGPEQ